MQGKIIKTKGGEYVIRNGWFNAQIYNQVSPVTQLWESFVLIRFDPVLNTAFDVKIPIIMYEEGLAIMDLMYGRYDLMVRRDSPMSNH